MKRFRAKVAARAVAQRNGGGAAEFSPTSITGCALWLDGADATTVTGTTTVTAWRDKSSAGRNLGVGSGTTSYVANAIKLNSSYMYVTSPVDLSAFTTFIVTKSNSAIDNQTVFIGRPNAAADYQSSDGFSFFMDSGVNSIRFYGTDLGADSTSLFGVTTSNLNVYTFQSYGTTLNAWLNGTTKPGGTLPTTRTSTAQGFAIGASWSGGYNNFISTSSINEILVFTQTLTTPQREQIEGYLAWKWGLQASLPVGHLYKSAAP